MWASEDDTRETLLAAKKTPGLGFAGASGLLALLYPQKFGTVDQFVVKTLRNVPTLPTWERKALGA